MSPNSIYLLHENKPEYSVMVHLYIADNELRKVTFSILKIVEENELRVYPLEELYSETKQEEQRKELIEDAAFVYEHFCGKSYEFDDIRSEYEI